MIALLMSLVIQHEVYKNPQEYLYNIQQNTQQVIQQIDKKDKQDRLLKAIARKEKSNPKKNRYGLMCFEGGRHLCVMSEEEAKKEVLRRLELYTTNYEDLTISGAIYTYAPPFENNTELYIKQITQWSGISRDTKIKDIL